jgi:hypothetical protein
MLGRKNMCEFVGFLRFDVLCSTILILVFK